MSYTLPRDLTLLETKVLVTGAELSRVDRGAILNRAVKTLCEDVVQQIANKYVKSDTYMGYRSNKLELRVYILSPEELHRIAHDAYEHGIKDGALWSKS